MEKKIFTLCNCEHSQIQKVTPFKKKKKHPQLSTKLPNISNIGQTGYVNDTIHKKLVLQRFVILAPICNPCPSLKYLCSNLKSLFQFLNFLTRSEIP